MRKRILIISVILMMLLVACGNNKENNNTISPTGTIETEDSNTNALKPTITPTPDITEDNLDNNLEESIPINLIEEMNVLEKYWINNNKSSGFFFEDNSFYIFVDGYKFIYDYISDNNSITISNETVLNVTNNGSIVMDNGISLSEYQETTKEEFRECFMKDSVSINHSNNKNSDDYIGMTVSDFIKTGAEITGYVGVLDNYEFSAYNEEKLEKYVITLKGNVRQALENNSSFDKYEEILGEFTIETIKIVKLDNSNLDKYIGKTLRTLTDDGISIRGYAHFYELLLYAYDDENNLIEVFLDETASDIYKGLKNPSFEIIKDLCKDCIIKKINYNVYW